MKKKQEKMTFYKRRQKVLDTYKSTLNPEDIGMAYVDARQRFLHTPLWRIFDVRIDNENGVMLPQYSDKKLEEALIEKLNKLFLKYFEKELKALAQGL